MKTKIFQKPSPTLLPTAKEDVKKLAYFLAEHDRLRYEERSAVNVRNQIDGWSGWRLMENAWARKGENNKEIFKLLRKVVEQGCTADKTNASHESWLETTIHEIYWKLVSIVSQRPLNSENDPSWLDRIAGIVSKQDEK